MANRSGCMCQYWPNTNLHTKVFSSVYLLPFLRSNHWNKIEGINVEMSAHRLNSNLLMNISRLCLSRIEIKSIREEAPSPSLRLQIPNENLSNEKMCLFNKANQRNRCTLCWDDDQKIQSGFQFNVFHFVLCSPSPRRCPHFSFIDLNKKITWKFRHSFWWAQNWQITEKITRTTSSASSVKWHGNESVFTCIKCWHTVGFDYSFFLALEQQGPLWGVYVIYSMNSSAQQFLDWKLT